MKVLSRKIIPYILVLVILIISILTCYHTAYAANIQPIVESYEIGKLIETWENPNLSVAQKLQDTLFYGAHGLIMPRRDLPTLEEYVNRQISEETGKEKNNVTEEDRRTWVNNNVSVTNNRIITTRNFNTVIKNVGNYYIEQEGIFPCYSLNLVDYLSRFSDGYQYNALRRFILAHQDEYWVGYNPYYKDVALWKKNSNHKFIGLAVGDYGLRKNCANISGIYDYNSWANVTRTDLTYKYDSSSHEYVPKENYPYWFSMVSNIPNNPSGLDSNNAMHWMTVARIDSYLRYTSLDLMKRQSTGLSPYYITNTWNNFVNNSGDTYTIDNSNYNPVTYGDVNNYITNNYEPGNEPDYDTIIKWIEEHRNPEPTPTPTPTPGPDNPVITPTPTPGPYNPTPTPGPDNPTPTGTVSQNSPWGGGEDPGSGKSIWDFLTELVSKLGDLINTIASSIGDVISSLAALPGQILDFFTIDTEQVSAALSEATVSMNNLKNEVIPSEQIKNTIAPLNMSEIYYPKLTIKTPAIIRQYYDEEEIILLDFEKWAKYFVVVRSLLVFSFWFAFIYYTLASVRPHIDIGS